MDLQVVCIFLLYLCSVVTSDWVEIPQITVDRKSLHNASSFGKFTTLTSPVTAVFTEAEESATLSSTVNKQPTKEIEVLIQSLPMVKHPNFNITDLKTKIESETLTKNKAKEKLNTLHENTEFENVEESNESDIINETLEEAKYDLFNKPNTSLSQKLNYLHKMESEMSAQIKKLSQGLWTERQSRGKKLLGFASMEGALMTIAFLTFAVFLVKVVHQFIQGLQSSELEMVALPTAPALRLSRPKRQQQDLAAAQLLQYMDEFRIKHRISCDSF